MCFSFLSINIRVKIEVRHHRAFSNQANLMIRSKKINLSQLHAWLQEQQLPASTNAKYLLRLRYADHATFPAIKQGLQSYINEAHEDARERLRSSLADDLSPFRGTPQDPAENYPEALHMITLKGYFGEIMAGLQVEHLGAHGKTGWCIPAYLFRHHDVELQHLEEINQKLKDKENYDPDALANRRPGRTGDDVLAFIMNDNGQISDVLVLEAKCVNPHNAATLGGAHAQVSKTRTPPVDILRLMEILKNHDTKKAKAWQLALTNYYRADHKSAKRYNGVSYICANAPKNMISWMQHDKPHQQYKATRGLMGIEVHMPEMERVVKALYRNT